LRLKKKKKKTSAGGSRRHGTGIRYRVVEKAMLKNDCELDSDIVGSLAPGTVIRCIETRMNSTGQFRVRCSKGWASAVAKDGSLLLQKVEDPDSGNAADASAAVGEMRAAAGQSSLAGSRPAQSLAQTDWQERFSAQHNRKYWVNSTTGQSSWVDPNQPAEGAAHQAATQSAGSQRGAPESAWDQRFSEQHNRHYWVDRSTGQSTWTDPTIASVQNPTHLTRRSASAVELEV
jgi:hypothetical protein